TCTRNDEQGHCERERSQRQRRERKSERPKGDRYCRVKASFFSAIRAPAHEQLPCERAHRRQHNERRQRVELEIVPALENAWQEELRAVICRHHTEVCERQEQHARVYQALPRRHLVRGSRT